MSLCSDKIKEHRSSMIHRYVKALLPVWRENMCYHSYQHGYVIKLTAWRRLNAGCAIMCDTSLETSLQHANSV